MCPTAQEPSQCIIYIRKYKYKERYKYKCKCKCKYKYKSIQFIQVWWLKLRPKMATC